MSVIVTYRCDGCGQICRNQETLATWFVINATRALRPNRSMMSLFGTTEPSAQKHLCDECGENQFALASALEEDNNDDGRPAGW